MSAELSDLIAADPATGLSRARDPAARTGLKAWPLLGSLTAFWLYVTLSNVLYAHSMQLSLSSISPGNFFAPWDARVIQHLFLYPILVGCLWTSLRIGWEPAWRAIPLQQILALLFSALAAPALVAGELLSGHAEHKGSPTLQEFLAGPEPPMWLASATNFLVTYGFALALVTGIALYRRVKDSQLRATALERALTSAHLAALRMQLSPHTLFNLLHTIRGQISWDPSAAQSMVVQLGDLLRRLLAAGERDFTRLDAELEFVRLYLELQQRRFSDRLQLDLVNADSLPNIWVPSLILQPLIENAVVHGLAGHSGPVLIRVTTEVDTETLLLRVTNTIGPEQSTEAAASAGTGIGLRNVRERLAVQFGERAALRVGANAPDTWVAEVRMPVLRDGPGINAQPQRSDARRAA